MFQDGRLTDIEAHRKQSTPTGAADVGLWRNTLATRRVSNQRSADAFDPNDSVHQGEWERPDGQLLVREEMRMAQCAAISRAVRIEVLTGQLDLVGGSRK